MSLFQEALKFQVVLHCADCKLRVTFQYANPERQFRYCISCGQPVEVEQQ